MERAEQRIAFAVGLDLGQASDFTALVVNDRIMIPSLEPATIVASVSPVVTAKMQVTPPTYEHRIRHIQRFALHTPYPDIVRQVGDVIASIKAQTGGRVGLFIDYTGVGRPVVDMFREAGYRIPITAITITSGQQAQQDAERPWIWTVPKKDLVGILQAEFHQEQLKIASSLPEAKTLTKELQNFRMKITAAANITFAAWREGDKDDLVLAAALAVWGGEKMTARGGLA